MQNCILLIFPHSVGLGLVSPGLIYLLSKVCNVVFVVERDDLCLITGNNSTRHPKTCDCSTGPKNTPNKMPIMNRIFFPCIRTHIGTPALGLGEELTNPLRKKRMLRNTHVEMLPLETKQSGGKLLPQFGSPGGSVSRGSITQP
jgi:hypothetical protein